MIERQVNVIEWVSNLVRDGRSEPTDDGAGTAYGLDVHVEVDWNGTVVSRPEFRDMYWSPAQMVAHMTVNGATLRDGDLFGSGTISGPEKGTRGCFLELTWSGTEPVTRYGPFSVTVMRMSPEADIGPP